MLETKAQYLMKVLREDSTCHALLIGKAASQHYSVRSVTEAPFRVLYDEVPLANLRKGGGSHPDIIISED